MESKAEKKKKRLKIQQVLIYRSAKHRWLLRAPGHEHQAKGITLLHLLQILYKHTTETCVGIYIC